MRVVFVLAIAGMVGCSALTSLDDLSGGQTDGSGSDATGSDATGSDANGSDVVQTNDAGDAGNGNLITNGGFENGQGGCGTNWGNGYGMTFSRVSPGHSGTAACLVCTNQANPTSYQINAIANIPVQAGNYYAEAWIETPWDGGIATQNAGIQVYFVGDAGTISGCTGDGTTYCQGSFVATSGWSTSSVTFVVTGSGQLSIDVHSYDGTLGSCFAIDDVALYAQ